MKNPLGRGKQKHTMKTATSLLTRPMNVTGSEVDYHERSGAAFLPNMEAHVIVPLWQSIVSGGYAAAAVSVVSFLLANLASGWVKGFTIWVQLESALVFGLITGFIVSWRAWEGNKGEYKDLLRYTEFANGPEIAPETRGTYKAEVRTNNNWSFSYLPFDRDNPQALVDFAAGVVCGAATFSEEGAKRYGYSVERFVELRDNMIQSNLAYWKNPNNRRNGVGLLKAGVALLKSVADNPPPDNYEPPADWGMSANPIQK